MSNDDENEANYISCRKLLNDEQTLSCEAGDSCKREE